MKPASPSPELEPDVPELLLFAQHRADSYALLSRVWGAEIDAPLWQQLQAMEIPSLAQLPALDAAYRDLQLALQTDDPAILTDLTVDYARLCLGSDPRAGADPYESVHRNKEGLMMQDEWEAVLALYYELGLSRSASTPESEDHLALELECLAQLCSRQEAALSLEQFPEASWWVDQQIRMLDEHLLRWVPSFSRRVQKLGRTVFYKAFARLTEEFLKADRELIEEVFNR